MKYVIVFVLSFSVFAQINPSFDCAKAQSKIENAICQNQELAHYDNLLSETYNFKKADLEFKKAYLSWLSDRNQCNSSNQFIDFCLRKKYVVIFDLILNKYQGFSRPFIPDAECFRPFLPLSNGDQGFYSTRVISEIRGCGNLNIKLETTKNVSYEVKFLTAKNAIYYYDFIEKYAKETFHYTLGVKFIKNMVNNSPTLTMNIIESYDGLKSL